MESYINGPVIKQLLLRDQKLGTLKVLARSSGCQYKYKIIQFSSIKVIFSISTTYYQILALVVLSDFGFSTIWYYLVLSVFCIGTIWYFVVLTNSGIGTIWYYMVLSDFGMGTIWYLVVISDFGIYTIWYLMVLSGLVLVLFGIF